MVIFVSRRLYFHISNVQRSSVATGIGGVIGNKVNFFFLILILNPNDIHLFP